MERARLENIIDSIRLNNDTYIRIRQIVKQEIENSTLQPRHLLKIAIASIFESERKNPGKLRALYYNTTPSPSLSIEQIILSESSSISHQNEQYGYSEDALAKVLLDEAEQSYNRIVDAITSNCINRMANDTQTFQVPDIQDGLPSAGGDNHKILDTGDLSQVNLVYNNITFQVYPDHKISDERNTTSKMDDLLGENELDSYNFSQE